MEHFNNRPDLLDLIGRKFHVRDVKDLSHLPSELRCYFESTALDSDMYIHSIIFNIDSCPEIGLVDDIHNIERLEYYEASDLIFSPASGSPQPLPLNTFERNGTILGVQQSSATAA
jgi:hypothetical protein